MTTYTQKPVNAIVALALAMMLAFGAFFMATEPADAASCWGRVANASYGNSSGYVYVRADTGCNVNAYLEVHALISLGGVYYQGSTNTGYGTWLDTATSNPRLCGSVAVGYNHYSGGGAGYGWTTDLWSC